MNGIIQENDLVRFDFYARHIRKFNPETRDVHVLPHIYSFITQYRQSGVFPGLKKLTVNFSAFSSQHAPSLLLLASASLIDVELEEIDPGSELLAASLLHNISMRSPALVSLRMRGAITPVTLDLIIQFKRLRDLAISQNHSDKIHNVLDIRPYFFLGIATLQNLTVLSLDIRSGKTPRWSNASLNSLRSLSVVGAPDIVYRVLCVITAIQLTEINIILVGSKQKQQYSKQFLEPFTHRFATMAISIQAIRMTSSIGDATRIPHGLLFQHVLSCKNLTELSVPIDNLTDDILFSSLCKGKKWPAMKALGFQNGCGELGTKPLLLSQIDSLLAIFPNLLRLSIPISLNMDPREIESMKARIIFGDPHYRLEELFLGAVANTANFAFKRCYKEFGPRSESFRDKLIISQFIDHLFPHLRKLYTSGINYVSRSYCADLETGVEAFHEKGQSSGVILS